MTKNFTFRMALLSLVISLLPALSFAQNKLQMLQVSGGTNAYTSNPMPYILVGKVFFPTSKKSFSFQNANTTFEPVFPKRRVVKMGFSGSTEKEEMESDFASTTILYKNVYENIDIQVTGRDENAIFSLVVHPYGKLDDIVFQVSNGKNWQNSSPIVWQDIDGKKQIVKSFFDVNENIVSLKCADFDAFENLKIEFPATPETPVALSKR
jgi:hypothetical protein